MRRFFRKSLTLMAVILLITGLAIPHFCMDDLKPLVKAEQTLKSGKIALDTHQDSSKAKDGCCVSHHCCAAKVLSSSQPVFKTAFYSNAGLVASPAPHFTSLDPNGLDRPPKSFA